MRAGGTVEIFMINIFTFYRTLIDLKSYLTYIGVFALLFCSKTNPLSVLCVTIFLTVDTLFLICVGLCCALIS